VSAEPPVDPRLAANAERTGGPRITVIVACFNDGPIAHEAVASLDGQEPVELVVVDDASTDPATAKALDALRDRRINVLRHEVNQGLSAARMTGLRATSGPFVFPLDSDDLVAPGALTLLAEALQSRPELAVVFADYAEFGTRRRMVTVPARLDPYRVAYRNEYPVSSMFRRSALERVGGWRDVAGLVGYEDWNLWMTLAEHGEQGVHVGAGTVALQRRMHGSRMLGDASRRHRELYGHLRQLHPALFADIRAHRRASDLPPLKRTLYPVLYGSRPPLGLWSKVLALRSKAGGRNSGSQLDSYP
jgi:glycosyltransferase involved in cell wall biosynthesis